MSTHIDNNVIHDIDDASAIAQLVDYIEYKFYCHRGVNYCNIICTIILAVVDGNHYGGYPSYPDKNYIEYGITCWVLDQYSAVAYVIDVFGINSSKYTFQLLNHLRSILICCIQEYSHKNSCV